MWKLELPEGASPVGYRFIVERYEMQVFPHDRWSFTVPKGDKRTLEIENQNFNLYLYPLSYSVEEDPLCHLEFALKHEGVNLLIMKKCFMQLSKEEVSAYILRSPTGKYARKIWFFYEWLMGVQLPIDDIGRASYIPLLDPNAYYCRSPKRSPRHRILNNLLGDVSFCPFVRKSPSLEAFMLWDIKGEMAQLIKQFDPNIFSRAVRYLYTKETMASWEIEREKPDKGHLARFVALLEWGDKVGELSKRMLIELQKEIVDPRFCLDDYRDFQNYIGEEAGLRKMIIHFITPKPADLPILMDGLLSSAAHLFKEAIHPVIVAAILSFGFVFLHPFWDGNGRLHRFLIHYTLSKCGFSPDRVVFPISAAMLRDPKSYDDALEYLSKPLLELITNYKLNDQGEMSVEQETYDFYRFIDFTPIVEYLFRCVQQTVHTDFEKELRFLDQYDRIKQALQQIVDMPDQKLDFFIKCVWQNNGALSQRKRESHFHMLADQEIEQMVDEMRKIAFPTT